MWLKGLNTPEKEENIIFFIFRSWVMINYNGYWLEYSIEEQHFILVMNIQERGEVKMKGRGEERKKGDLKNKETYS